MENLMMFGDPELRSLARELLEDFTLEELLEMNDLDDVDVIEILIRGGHLTQPERELDV